MADFCTHCAKRHFGKDATPEIDVDAIFASLDPEWYQAVGICEGCTLVAIAKTKEGNMEVAYLDTPDDKWETEYPRVRNYGYI